MIQINIKTNRGRIRINSPSSWMEITIGQLIKIENDWDKSDPVKLFSIITGIDVDVLENSKQEGLENDMLAICAFYYDQPQWDKTNKPDLIQIGDNVYKTPKSIDNKSLGQKILLNQLMIKSGEDLISSIPKTIAIYMQSEVDGKYDSEKVDEMAETILLSPAMDCYGLAIFFFQQSGGLIDFGEINLQQSSLPNVPIKRILKGSQALKASISSLTSS